jgi:cytochrome c2
MSGAASLEDAGSKFHPAWMMQWLLSPSAVVPEARMPAMLSGDDDAKRRSAGDLATFLSTLRVPSLAGEPVLTSDPTWIKRGEETFSTLGCVACHRLADIPALPSDPRRTLAHVRAKWLPTPLRQFLMKPEAGHAATRMPNFHLSLDEANGLAALLLSRGAEPAAFTVGDAKHGRDLAGQLGCANCHAITGVSRSTSGPALAQLVARPAAAGCLAVEEKNRGAAPRFGLVDGERQAVSRFMESDLASLRRKSLHETAEEHFQSLRCAACHQREDAEDFWFKLEAADPTKKPPANPYDDDDSVEKTIHRQRPPLTLAGEKLRPEWIEDFVAGRISYKPRPKLPSRMPSFPAYAHAIALGLAEQHGFGAASPARQQPDPALADAGFALARKGALACMDCHAVGTQQALAGADTVTINFAYIPERLNRRYYDRYLQDPPRVLPGTMMPKFVDDHGRTGVTAHFDGDARKQFEALWHFMLRQDAASAPR